MKILSGLSDAMDVHIFFLNPSREYWAYIRSRREIIRELSKRDDYADALDQALYYEEGNALLSSLGRVGKEFQCVLEQSADYAEPADDIYADPQDGRGRTLLHQLQSDVLNLRLRRPGAEAPLPIDAEDRTILFHACHSPMREVQVLHDQLIDIFQEESDISPHDVVVMMPDITEYAPVIEAVFGANSASIPTIAYTISDQGMAGQSQVVRAFLQIISLVGSRLRVQDILDLLAMDPVRVRFDLSVSDLETLREWLVGAGVRWGVDADHRAAFDQPLENQNTWRFGLDRLLLGLAMPNDSDALFCGTAPFHGIEGADSEVLGKGIDFCETLFDCLMQLKAPRQPAAWQVTLQETLGRLISADDDTASEYHLLGKTLETLAQTATTAGFSEAVGIGIVSEWLAAGLKRRPSVRGFLSGGVTFCNLLPMRSIPFKVVCLLGMNDADYPRSSSPSGFDLTALAPRPGDRSVRNDDRYLFLEALLSARKRFLIFYIGQAVKDNSVMPPSTVVDELLDVLEEGYYIQSETDGAPTMPFRDHLVTRHPLQPFHPDYFASGGNRLFSYARPYFEGARAFIGERSAPRPFFKQLLPEDPAAGRTIHIEDLIRFFTMPADYLLRNRLGMVLYKEPEEIDDREPLVLGGLSHYQVGERLLNGALAGEEISGMLSLIRAEGVLPLGTPGSLAADGVSDGVVPIFDAAGGCLSEAPLPPFHASIEIKGVHLFGEVGDIFPAGRVTITYGAVNERRKLSLWVSHVFFNAVAGADIPCSSFLIGKGGERYELVSIRESAIDILGDLIEIYKAGMCGPLPFFPMTSFAYAKTYLASNGPEEEDRAMAAALKKWKGGKYGPEGEGTHYAVQRVFGGLDPFKNEKEASDLFCSELSFTAVALRVFGPLFAAEARCDNNGKKTGRK